ncbi:HAD-IC family P-type ATPase [Patescibacteria group bacterium]|nr:HAD-IC family P-type ATPase [Patescibacteria group bacterium]MBU1868600.1 HAD-IC family P-type ATPase [Patescibacteria group bacterium]
MSIIHSLEIEKIKQQLQTDPDAGLTELEAKDALQRYGPNALPEKKPPSSLRILIIQFRSPLVYVLLFALMVSVALAHWEDALVVSGSLVLNTILGFIQEKKAINILEKLKELVHHQAKVIRDGQEKLIAAEELVPGDILVLDAGDKVSADARIIKENDLETVEAALTGESVPSEKNVCVLPEGTAVADQVNMLFMGTVVSKGKGRAVVVATGIETELGKIARLVAETEEEQTPLQEQLAKFSIFLSRLVAIICAGIFLLGFFQGRDVYEMLAIAVAVAVAAIPEGLLVALTVVLALGMQRILRQKGLVRRLVAAETLGSTSVICSDKTGTLTKGEMQVAHIHCGGFIADGDVDIETHGLALKISALCNNAVVENIEEELEQWRIIGDPTEKALLIAAVQGGYDSQLLSSKYPRLAELPFNEERKFMATLHQDEQNKEKLLMVKGAPELVLSYSIASVGYGKNENFNDIDRKKIVQSFEELSQKGLRVLGVAYKKWDKETDEITDEDISDLSYVASISLKDPLREEAKATIELCRQAGITPVLITGDHLLTAMAIAKEVGIVLDERNVIRGEDLDKMSVEEFEKRVKDLYLYARVTPQHKMRIIDAWQKRGEVVAMTGDGVNDAPALKKADIGVALGSGTEVAKEASDLVLLDDNFSTIVSAVKEGRVIFDNLRKIITYLLADSFSEMILVIGGLVIGLGSPITAAQILWINLITDGLPDLALTMEKPENDVMERPPRKREEGILNQEMKVIIFCIGIFTDIVLLGLFWFLSRRGMDMVLLRTFIFAALGLDSLLYVFSCRSLRKPLWRINPLANTWLLLAVLGGWVMQTAAIYWLPLQSLLGTVSLPLNIWWYLFGLAIFKVIGIESVKEVFIHKELSEVERW